jgi:tRNA 5-methylaminomethyl-2-thiouridine biosynthesis bifunctional protein
MPLTPAQFDLSCESALHSTLYDDLYASADGAFAQAAHVFLGGNDLPQRWAAAQRFVIVETGFGAAVNFLATWEAWLKSAPPGARLHYISVEKHPFLRNDLARVLARSSHCAPLAAQLLEQYPLPVPGFHRLTFQSARIVLTLRFGDVLDMLRELDARAQVFFLDGFAPAKNPQMWSDPVFAELARLAAPGATAASYTVAAAVRDGCSVPDLRFARRPASAANRTCCAHAFRARTSLCLPASIRIMQSSSGPAWREVRARHPSQRAASTSRWSSAMQRQPARPRAIRRGW